VVLVGDDPASQVYVRNKGRACDEAGMRSAIHRLPADVTQGALLTLIDGLMADERVDGVLVQLPLPKHIEERAVTDRVLPEKDVDGFHPSNVGALWLGREGMVPCTPRGCMRLLDAAGVTLEGARAVVVGRSNIVGKPMAALLLQRNATVVVAHSKTRDLAALCASADVLIAAVGKANMVRGDWVKPGAAVIDVGINRGADGKLVGDVDYAAVVGHAGAITPVPGGVGPMTIACLLENTVRAAWRRAGYPKGELTI
jgi:methylenetetrahydrofolate dehydrogenase (NADP+)/methenyltetrahydrofolate cyclohydrolase